MNTFRYSFFSYGLAGLASVLLLSAAAGCGARARFNQNAVEVIKAEISDQRTREIADVLVALFGTPDDPHVPPLDALDVQQVLDINKLRFASGAVGSDAAGRSRGLYREHCAHCHGVTGDGAGPTAQFLNPYPRDYRLGSFKFKSTPQDQKPTHDDLKRILINGIPGTAMPSFLVLPDNEIDALVHYVRYLSVRGEVERFLIDEARDLDDDESLFDLSAAAEESEQDFEARQAAQISAVRSLVSLVVERWLEAETAVAEVSPPDPDRDLDVSIARGRELFYGVADCKKCHGEGALGDGETTNYDDWTKLLEPERPERLKEYLAVGALPPRTIIPRNLRHGVYRGGRRPIDLFWRVRNGIKGTPMPAAPAILSDDDVWCLIDFVRSLPYDPLSDPRQANPENQRERL